MSQSLDAAVIGAGPAGLTAAINLAVAGWKVVIIEKSVFPRDKVCGGFIGPENKAVFAQWNILNDLMERGAVPVRGLCLASAYGRHVRVPIRHQGAEDYGLGISRRELDGTLLKKALALGVDVADSTVVTASHPEGRFTRLTLTSGPRGIRMVRVRHLINASGAGKQTKAANQGTLFGVAADFQNVREMNDDVYLYFMNKAHLGVNRFERDRVNVCYVIQQEQFKDLGRSMEGAFQWMKRENASLGHHMRGAEQISPWKGTSLQRGRTGFCFFANGQFVVGDAVGLIHPVFGGGNSLAINSALLLTELMSAFAPDNVPVASVAHAYAKAWKRSFQDRVRFSWICGAAAHNRVVSEAAIRFFQLSRGSLNRIFAGAHRPLDIRVTIPNGGMA